MKIDRKEIQHKKVSHFFGITPYKKKREKTYRRPLMKAFTFLHKPWKITCQATYQENFNISSHIKRKSPKT